MSELLKTFNMLHDHFGLSDDAIGYECGYSRQHINEVKHGKRPASQKLIDAVNELFLYCYENKHKPTRKPYTWKDGKDTRGKKSRRAAVKRDKPVRYDKPARLQPVKYDNRESIPEHARTFTGAQDID